MPLGPYEVKSSSRPAPQNVVEKPTPVPDRPKNGVTVNPTEEPGWTVGLSVLCAKPATSQTVLATNSTAPDAANAYATVLSVFSKLRSLAYCAQLAANVVVAAGHAPPAC